MGRPSDTPLPAFPVTAFSGLSALGLEPGSVVDASEQGRTGLVEPPTPLPVPTRCGVVSEAATTRAGEATSGDPRVARIALGAFQALIPAVRAAMARWGADRVALIVGTSTGGIAETEAAYAIYRRQGSLPEDYDFDRHHAFSALLEVLARESGVSGPAYVVSTACASSLKVFGAAQRLLATGRADAVLVGGADSLCQTTLRGFGGLRVLSSKPCRPFDAARDGISIGEGAGFVLLERDSRDALAYLLGVGEGSDAHHMTAPHPEGRGAVEAMSAAIAMAGVDPAHVDHIHAHGTGTSMNDLTEGEAIARVFGTDTLVSSTKGATGHLLGAAGALSAAITLDSIVRRRLPVNVGVSTKDPAIPVHVVTHATVRPVRNALVNTFAFGGSNASALFGSAPARAPVSVSRRDIYVCGAGFFAPGLPSLADWLGDRRSEPSPPPATLLGPRVRGRASLLSRMVAEVVQAVADAARVDLRATPMIFASAYGEMTTTLALLDSLTTEDALLSPIRFQASVHNTALGILSIQLDNRAFATALAAGRHTGAMGLVEATAWLGSHGADVILVVADESAPKPLWRDDAYPPMAAALLLSTRRTDFAGARLGALRREALPPPSPRTAVFEGNPSSGLLTLIERFARRDYGTVPLETRVGAHGWIAELTPL